MNHLNTNFLTRVMNTPAQLVEPGIYTSFETIQPSAYDAKAYAYEWLVKQGLYNRLMWGTRPSDYSGFAYRAVQGNPSEILDIGCGGLSQTHCVYRELSTPAVLLDSSLNMLRLGKKRIEDSLAQLPQNLAFLQAEAFLLPFADDSFERVVSFGMIHLFDQKQDFIREALRVLKPDGTFYFSVLTTDRHLSKKYLLFLQRKNEVGLPVSSEEMVSMIQPLCESLDVSVKGSMVFISGEKRKLESLVSDKNN